LLYHYFQDESTLNNIFSQFCLKNIRPLKPDSFELFILFYLIQNAIQVHASMRRGYSIAIWYGIGVLFFTLVGDRGVHRYSNPFRVVRGMQKIVTNMHVVISLSLGRNKVVLVFARIVRLLEILHYEILKFELRIPNYSY
jgi:hypothetical protein